MQRPMALVAVVWTLLCVGGGCAAPPEHREANSFLSKPQMSPSSVMLEIFFVRYTDDHRELGDSIWEQIDEQKFDTGLRQELARHGLRAGVLAGQLPLEVQKLLESQSEPITDSQPNEVEQAAEEEAPAQLAGANVVTLGQGPLVRLRQLQIRAGRRGEIIASSVFDELPLLRVVNGEVCGKTLPKCQAMFSVTPYPEGDGNVRIELVPELHYGDPVRRFSGADGIWKLETSRPRKSFTELTVTPKLAPGDMIVVGALGSKSGTLGRWFFEESNDGVVEQKLLLVRVARSQYDNLFALEAPEDE